MPLASGAGRTVLPNTGAFAKRQRSFRKRPQPLYRLQEPSLHLLWRLGSSSCICAMMRIYMLTHLETIFNAFVLMIVDPEWAYVLVALSGAFATVKWRRSTRFVGSEHERSTLRRFWDRSMNGANDPDRISENPCPYFVSFMAQLKTPPAGISSFHSWSSAVVTQCD